MASKNPDWDTEGDLPDIVLEDMRELDEDTQDTLLCEFWPFPIQLPDWNTTGIDCAVVVLRRIFRHLPADNHCRAVMFGERDHTRYEAGKEELRRYRALFRYAWHHLPDLNNQSVSRSRVLRLDVMNHQGSLLDALLVDPHMDQSRISFEALMESDFMLTSSWGRSELQMVRNVVGWQEKGKTDWQTKERAVKDGPIKWDGNRELSLENKINNLFDLRGANGGNTWMMLPSWPNCLRVKMVNSAPVPLVKVIEQGILDLKGFEVRPGNGVDVRDSHRLSQAHNSYKLAAAVVTRSHKEGNDLVYTFNNEGLALDALRGGKEARPHVGPDLKDMLIKEAMLYYSRVDNPKENIDDVSMSDQSQDDEDLGLTDDQKFRERIKALDPGAKTGLTHLSQEFQDRLPKDIAPALREARKKFFSGFEHLIE